MAELDRCPFCGSNNISVQQVDVTWHGTRVAACCNNCGARGGTATYEFEAIQKWNKRYKELP